MDSFPLSMLLVALFGMGAGYAINRAAMLYLGRYTGRTWRYGGLMGRLFGREVSLQGDMVAVELLAPLLSMAAFCRVGAELSLWFNMVIVYIILLLCLLDGRLRILPNALTFAGSVVGFASAFFREGFGWPDALAGMAVGAGFPLLMAALYFLLHREEGLGMGDVKLLAFFGTFAGWEGVMLIIVFGSFAAALWGVAAAYCRKRSNPLKYELAFGPFLGGAALIFISI